MQAAVPAPAVSLLWLTDAGALPAVALEGYATWLGEGERRRCARFARAERRRQFIVGRALLRFALGRLLGSAPRAIVLHERPGAAPALDMPRRVQGNGVGFSISHSGPWVACAASTERALGLDIERIDQRRDVLALARQAFDPDAVARLEACAGTERIRAFYRMWCRHEAHIKLGRPATQDYVFEQPGLAIVLSSAGSLAPAPQLELLDFAALWRAAAEQER